MRPATTPRTDIRATLARLTITHLPFHCSLMRELPHWRSCVLWPSLRVQRSYLATTRFDRSRLLRRGAPRNDKPRLFGLLDLGGDDLRIGADPFGLLDELAALDLVDLHPAAAFVILRGHGERRHDAAERELLDRLEALLDLLAGRLLAAIRLHRVADRLDVQRRIQDAAIVHHRIAHLLRRLFALRLVHGLDFLAHRVVVA